MMNEPMPTETEKPFITFASDSLKYFATSGRSMNMRKDTSKKAANPTQRARKSKGKRQASCSLSVDA